MSERTPPGSSDRLLRLVVVVLAAILLLPLLMMALAMPMMGMMGWWDGGMVGHSPLWGVGMMLVWLLVLVGIGYALYRALAGAGPLGETDPALEALRMAYARGELTDEEFEQRRQRLRRDE